RDGGAVGADPLRGLRHPSLPCSSVTTGRDRPVAAPRCRCPLWHSPRRTPCPWRVGRRLRWGSMARTVLVWSGERVGYDFGAGHPMAPARLVLTVELMRELGVLDADDLEVLGAPVAEDADLLRIHTADYVAAVRDAEGDGQA